MTVGTGRAPTPNQSTALVAGAAAILVLLGTATAISGLTSGRAAVDVLGRRLGALSVGEVSAVVTTAVGMLVFTRTSPSRPWARAAFIAAVYLALNGTAIDREFTPPDNFGRMYESFYAVNQNQSYGRLLAASIRQGDGLFASATRASYPNYRMPGYPLFVAGVGAVSGAPAADWVAVEQATILAQLFVTCLALLAVTLALDRSFPPVTTLAVGLVLACLPSFVHRTQVDALVFASGLLITAAVLWRLEAERRGDATARGAVLVHLAFAASFALRSDVFLGWCVASLVLHWRNRRLLVIPAVLFVAIGGTYGLTKGAHGYDRGPTTDNLGHVAFVGLWQVPDDRFGWEPTDQSYGLWVGEHGHEYGAAGTNRFATGEVLRFYLTYPGYTASLVLHKSLDYFLTQAGSPELFRPSRLAVAVGRIFQPWTAWVFAVTILLALWLGYERRRTFLLAWPVFLSLPLFILFQSSGGRFVTFVTASLVLAGLPLLLDRRFHATVRGHAHAPAVALGLLLLLPGARILDTALLDWSWFRYGAPFLNPAHSTLALGLLR